MTPSHGELNLLKHLWRSKRLSAREIHDASVSVSGWSYSTTRKTLDRMVDKGLIAVEPVHGIKTFSACQSKLSVMAALIKDFTSNILEADAPLPAATFAHSKLISKDEIEELKSLLAEPNQEKSGG